MSRLLILSLVFVFLGCGQSDRRAEFRLTPDSLSQPPAPEIARRRVKKRLREVAELVGLDENRPTQDPAVIASFSQPVEHGPVEIKAHVEGAMIVVEVSQQKPPTSRSVLFERAKALMETRLRRDFPNGVSETSTADGWWSFIRSEDARRP